MSKFLQTSILTLLAALLVSLPVYAYSNDIQVTIDGAEMVFAGQSPIIVDEHVLIPVRSVFEQLGHSIGWDVFGETRQVTISGDMGLIAFNIGNGTIDNLGQIIYTSDIAPQIIGESTMLLISAIIACVNSLGHYAVWDADRLTLNILSSDSEENILRIMNASADRLREMGHHVIIPLPDEFVGSQLLFANPGLAFGIVYFMVYGEVVAAVNSELFGNASAYGIFDSGIRSRTFFVSWRPFRGSRIVFPIYYIQVSDEEVLLLEERFLS